MNAIDNKLRNEALSLRCTTHFHACDCREEKFKDLESELKLSNKWVMHHRESAQCSHNKLSECEEKLREAENSYEKLATAFDDLNVQNNFHCKQMIEHKARLKVAVEALEDFILESDHLPVCTYKNGFGYAYECKCMDRNYYNKDAVLIRAKAALATINNEENKG